jgi:hypothetical protein
MIGIDSMTELWCVKTIDNIFAQESKEAAEAAAAEYNKTADDKAIVDVWPWGGTSHNEDLRNGLSSITPS